MEKNNKLALIIAFYLSRFDVSAVSNLGYKNFIDVYREIGKQLCVKPNTIKNMRDEFDSIHDNFRKGWHQRPLRPSRLKVVEEFQDLSEEDLHEIVIEIITNSQFRDSEQCADITDLISDDNKLRHKDEIVVRGTTGKKAENFFVNYFNNNNYPVDGILIDTRDLGCGYDFKVIQEDAEIYFEVKGLSSNTGGLLLTNKEWQVAKEMKENYYLVIVSNLNENEIIKFIKNPAKVFEARKNIYTAVQVNWSISQRQLNLLQI